MNDFPELMAIGDASDYLQVSRQYIHRLARGGKLRCQETSGGKIFLRSEIERFHSQRKKRAKKDSRIRI